ncbi:RNase adapter RapZ [Pseudazoarcus pumilus]|uniref:RNase adapter RapZ n=1 Tax=Pseudazoarcus pumilus TaxID=2067960 RepID=A0A2I6S3N5_9RHOO|nr:RNase adapter RapZ [Pseudazoarcus pumilus]AUN93845.1 RNase adapter RapZ [Pseudazoarcus pumilus]
MQIVLISGLSGSGKSVVLKALEDYGYFAVDNLPAMLLPQLVEYLRDAGHRRVAVAVDVRSGASIAALPERIADTRKLVDDLRLIFLNARDDTLIARFSETRRRHPLASDEISLAEAIHHERAALEAIAEMGHNFDTSDMAPNTLRAWVKDFVGADPTAGLTLMFQSFGFKLGIPLDADLVFDVRCLPNPHYDPVLRPLTGCDAPVAEFLSQIPDVGRMAEDIRRFVADWLPSFVRDNRSYLTVAIGCTGGQHRSVYLAERLAREFRGQVRVLVRHRSIEQRKGGA